MKNEKIMSMVVIMMTMFATVATTSCIQDSSFLGLEEELAQKSPQGDNGYRYDADLTMEFDTTACQLYTVRQTIEGVRNILENGDTVATQDFARDLNLEINCETQDTVYVAEEKDLFAAEVVSSSKGEISEKEDRDDEFCTINKEQIYTITLSNGVKVTATAVWQALRCEVADTTFACASVANAKFLYMESARNDEASTEEKTVCDASVYLAGELVNEKKDWDSTYVVRIPTVLVYVDGEVPTPEEIETRLENVDYRAAFKAEGANLTTEYQVVSGEEACYRNDVEINREGFAKDLNLQAIATTAQEIVYVETEEELYDTSLAGSSQGGDYVSKDVDGRFTTSSRTLPYNFRLSAGENITVNTEYQYVSYGDTTLPYSAIPRVRFNRTEIVENREASTETLQVVNAITYLDVEVVEENPEEAAETKAATTEKYVLAIVSERALRKELPKDELVEKTYRDVVREIVDANSERISWTEVETWTVSGEKTRTISFVLYRHFQSPSLQTVYTANDQYNTVSNDSRLVRENESVNGNWTVTTRYMQYSSTATNGVDPFNNVYSYDYQKAIYTDEYYTLTFDYADWTINEGNSTLTKSGEETINGVVYNVSNYVNNINTVYAVSCDSYAPNASAEARIYVEKPIEKIIPDAWGKILGAAISAVPTDPNGSSAQKCICIRTDKGAVAIPFSMNANVPSVSSILSGYFVEGNFSAEYNSGYYTNANNHGSYDLGKWAPAIAKDEADRISYFSGNTKVRVIRHSTLNMWNWRGGNLSTVVDGYEFSVSNEGVLTVSVNGNVVMQIR